MAPGKRAEAAVKDGAWLLAGCVNVHEALGGDMAVEEERDQTGIEKEGVALLVVLDQCCCSLVRC
jgi:hypothetical protein